MAAVSKTVAKAAKNIATAAAVAAIRKKYGKNAPEPNPDEGRLETVALVEKLEQANRNLSYAVASLVARASKGGVANAEIARLTGAIGSLAKGVK